MSITIAAKLKIFSHASEVVVLVPKTTQEVRIFPTALQIVGHQDHIFPLTGPVRDFTVEIDLEKELITVFGQAKEGFFRYLLFAEADGLYLFVDKGPLPFPLKTKTALAPLTSLQPRSPSEKVSLGSHKAGDWEMMLRRKELAELVPFWLRAGQLLPPAESSQRKGNFALLERLETAIQTRDRADLEEHLLNFFAASFSGIFVPQVCDPHFLGLSHFDQSLISQASPFPLLKKSATLLRTLFFTQTPDTFSFLPCLPIHFHAGRFVHLQTDEGDRIDFEWSKKLLRRVILYPAATRKVILSLQKPLDTFRVRKSKQEKGFIATQGQPFSLIKDQPLFLDRFQK